MRYYKFLTADNTGYYSWFDFTAYLPKNGKPGKWLPKQKNLTLCERGWHACAHNNLMDWANAQLYEVELKGEILKRTDKVAAEQMRFIRKIDAWNEKTARLVACRCARDVLPLFEAQYPDDRRPRNAIEVAEKYANGEATADELYSARAAAMDAARAAWDAAKAAARAAAKAAAWDAAWEAAWAAWDAARDAAWDKYNGWLVEMLGLEQEVF